MTNNVGVFFGSEGKKMYKILIGQVEEFDLSIPFDYSTAVYVGTEEIIKPKNYSMVVLGL